MPMGFFSKPLVPVMYQVLNRLVLCHTRGEVRETSMSRWLTVYSGGKADIVNLSHTPVYAFDQQVYNDFNQATNEAIYDFHARLDLIKRQLATQAKRFQP